MVKEFEVHGEKFTMEVNKLKKESGKDVRYGFYSIKTTGKDYKEKIEVADKHLFIQIKQEEIKATEFAINKKVDITKELKDKGFQ